MRPRLPGRSSPTSVWQLRLCHASHAATNAWAQRHSSSPVSMPTPPPGDPESGDPLEPVLRDVEAELRRYLQEACEAEASGVSTGTTSEIRRLEDTLLAAAIAAEQTIVLRRHIDRRKEAAEEARSAALSASLPNESGDRRPKVREFRDARGELWRAWPVTPGQAREGRTAQRYLGDFQKGWICFEALERSARRRLPKQPPRWTDLTDSELAGLLDEAISAPVRKGRTDRPTLPPGSPIH